MAWVCVLRPSAAAFDAVKPLLADAYTLAVGTRRVRRRGDRSLPADVVPGHGVANVLRVRGQPMKSDWQPAPTPSDEAQRTRRIVRLGLRGGQQHESLDQITALAAALFDVPMALVTLIDGDRQIFLSKFGLDAEGTGRDESFCGHGIHSQTLLVVDDALADERFAGNPLVLGGPFVRSYLGAPLMGGPAQSAIGALCLVDPQPRVWTRAEQDRLAALSTLVESYLEGLAYRHVWDDSPLALVILDREGRCLRSNQAFERLTGRPQTMLVDQSITAFVLPVDRGVLSAMLTSTFLQRESPTRRELRYTRLTGEIVSGGTSMSRLSALADHVVCVIRDISLELRTTARSGVVAEVRRELGEPLGEARELARALLAGEPTASDRGLELDASLARLDMLIDARLGDLGARVRAEEELRASERRLRSVVENVLGPLLVLDDRGRIVDANAGALDELGWEYAQLVGASMRVVKPDFSEAEGRRWFAASADSSRDGLALPDELATFVRRDGTELGVELRRMLMDWNGPGRLVLIARDVTAARRRETELRKERDDLAATVETGTARLTEQQRMEETIKQSLAEKETLLKEIHHRVKNNLQIVSSLLMLQQEQMASVEARSMIAECVQRVRSMALVHQHLYGATTLELINLAAYARELADSLRYTLAPHARVRVVATPVEMTVENAVPFGLILNELITNAFKYGVPAGARAEGAEYDLQIEITEENRQLTLVVRDRGPGLPPGFNFAKGQSLGLQLVRSLARQLKARVSSRTDGGAVFELTFRV
jgi:PAS domain S-box-containing protein